MDCKSNENDTGFLDYKLNSRELKDFLDHIEKCRECKEELSIQFLIRGRNGKTGRRGYI